MRDKDCKILCEACLPAVRRAGAFIKDELGRVAVGDIEIKAKNSLVSYVDKTAEEILVSDLQVLLPSAGFITEEETVTQGGAAELWIIDPLDGTNNFLHGIPHFAVSVGLQVDGDLQVGIVLDVMRDECFFAWKGGGAYLNGQRISVSPTKHLSDAIIGTGFPYQSSETHQLTTILTDLMVSARGVRRLGAAALDLAYVACGRFDAYYEARLSSWDMAGGALIVSEAGGKVCALDGSPDFLTRGSVLASNLHLKTIVQDKICNVWRAEQ
ncbi:MAG: inositol monophosphatase family protein [Bacteroidota bacterium]